jgi:hypothetical protein
MEETGYIQRQCAEATPTIVSSFSSKASGTCSQGIRTIMGQEEDDDFDDDLAFEVLRRQHTPEVNMSPRTPWWKNAFISAAAYFLTGFFLAIFTWISIKSRRR